MTKILFFVQGQEAENCGPQAKSSDLPVFVNKVLLAHSHTHSVIYVYISYATVVLQWQS